MLTASRPKVIVYKSLILPYSETFIYEQVSNLTDWSGVLCGEERHESGVRTKDICVKIVGHGGSLLGRASYRISIAADIYRRGVIRHLRRENAQLIHAHFGTEAVRIWPTAQRLRLPLLVTLHGSDINIDRKWWESGEGGFLMTRYPRRLLKLAQQPLVHFVAVSNAIRQRAVQYGIPEDKISVSYIGIDTERFVPGPSAISDRNQVLFVGRLVEKKGCKYLIDAFSRIGAHFPEAELVIVGDGPLRGQLEEQARKTGRPIRFVGPLNPGGVREHMDKSRVLCLPSVTASNGDAEGFGLVILEAQSSGIPVITSARGGAKEGILHGETGYAYTEGDVDSLAHFLLKLFQEGELADRLGREARKYVRKSLDIRSCTARLEELYTVCALKVPADA